MKTIKHMALAGLLLLSGSAIAQKGADPEMRADKQVRMLQQELELSPEQEAALRETLMAAEKEAQPHREACDKAQKQVDAILEKSYAEFGTQLTHEQQKKLAILQDRGALDAGCGSGAGKAAGCGSGDAKAGGCCAGGKAKAEPAKRESAPAATPKSSIR